MWKGTGGERRDRRFPNRRHREHLRGVGGEDGREVGWESLIPLVRSPTSPKTALCSLFSPLELLFFLTQPCFLAERGVV